LGGAERHNRLSTVCFIVHSRAEQVHWNGEQVCLLPRVDYRRPDALDRVDHDVDGPVPDVGTLGEVGLTRRPHVLWLPSLRGEDVLERQLERLLVSGVRANPFDLDEHRGVAEVHTRRGSPLCDRHEEGLEAVRRLPHKSVLHHLNLRLDETIRPRERDQILDLFLFGVVGFGKLLLLLHLRLNKVLLLLLLLWGIAVRRPNLLIVLLLMVLNRRRRLVRPVVVIE